MYALKHTHGFIMSHLVEVGGGGSVATFSKGPVVTKIQTLEGPIFYSKTDLIQAHLKKIQTSATLNMVHRCTTTSFNSLVFCLYAQRYRTVYYSCFEWQDFNKLRLIKAKRNLL